MAASKQFLLNYDSNILLPYTTLDCILSNENSDPDSAKATGIYAITDSLLKNIREFLSYHGEQAVTGLEIKASQIDSSVANILGLIRVTSDDSGEVGTAEQFVKIYGLNLDNKLSSGYYLAKDGACHPIATQTSDIHDAYDVSIYIRPYEANDGTEDPIQSKIDINIRYDTQYIDVQEKQFYNRLAQKSKHCEDSSVAEGATKIYASYTAANPEDANSTVTNIVVKDIGQNKPVQLVNGLFSPITAKGTNANNQIRPVYINANGEITHVTESIGLNGTNTARPIYVNGGTFSAITSNIGSETKHIYMVDGELKASNNTTPNDKLLNFSSGALVESTADVGSNNKPIYISDGKFTELGEDIGNSKTPVYFDGGVIREFISKIGASNRPVYFDPCVGGFTQCSGNVGTTLKPVYINDGTFAECATEIGTSDTPIYISTNGFTKCSSTVGGSDTPTYMDGGKITKCTITCNTDLVKISSGTISEHNISKGSAIQPVYCAAGKFEPLNVTSTSHLITLTDGKFGSATSVNVGTANIPVYCNAGNFSPCSAFDPADKGGMVISSTGSNITWKQIETTEIKRPDYSIQKYMMFDPSQGVIWGDGNTTTSGSLSPTAGELYYVVGISEGNVEGSNTFKKLVGAKNGSNSGLYFKNCELYQTSDERLKTFTDDIDINFDNLATIKKGIYHWKDDPNKISDIGVTAQSLEALYPEIVDENNGTKTVAYNRLGVIALAAIDKLHLRVKELENEIKELKAELKKK